MTNPTTKERVEVTVRFNKRVLWDNWGHLVTAFREGDIVQSTKPSTDQE